MLQPNLGFFQKSFGILLLLFPYCFIVRMGVPKKEKMNRRPDCMIRLPTMLLNTIPIALSGQLSSPGLLAVLCVLYYIASK